MVDWLRFLEVPRKRGVLNNSAGVAKFPKYDFSYTTEQLSG
jgi:hypothetical protein